MRLRRVLAVLCVSQITSWGILYYAFTVLASHIGGDTGWSATQVTAAFSAGQVVAAGVGIGVGRWLDRHGPRPVMSIGSVVAVVGLVVVASAGSLPWFFVGWALTGVAMGAVLYPPAFAALTRWGGEKRVAALTVLTLAGGLASTVFAPLTTVLVRHLDWRQTYLVLALVLAVVTVPAHVWGLRAVWPSTSHVTFAGATPVAVVLRSRAFLALTLAIALASFASFAVLVNLVPIFASHGVDAGVAAIALALGGVGQVLGRLGYGPLDRRTSVTGRTAAVLAAVAVTAAALGVLETAMGLVVVAVVAGMARGVFTLIQATAVTDRWGTASYGRLNGMLTAPATLALALGPWGGAAIAAALGGYDRMCLVLGGLGLAAAGLALAAGPRALAASQDASGPGRQG